MEMLTSEQMDAAAEIALNELRDEMPQTVTVPIARWWAKHYMKAGHKRLGRGLVQLAKNMKGVPDANLTTEDDVAVLRKGK